MIWLFASLRFAVSRLTERMPAETKISILSSHFLSNLENRGHLRMRQSWFGEGALEKDFLLVPCNITYCPFTSCLLSSSVLIMCSDYQPSPRVPHGGGPPRQGDFHPGFFPKATQTRSSRWKPSWQRGNATRLKWRQSLEAPTSRGRWQSRNKLMVMIVGFSPCTSRRSLCLPSPLKAFWFNSWVLFFFQSWRTSQIILLLLCFQRAGNLGDWFPPQEIPQKRRDLRFLLDQLEAEWREWKQNWCVSFVLFFFEMLFFKQHRILV